MAFTIKVNGAQHSVDVDGDTPLLWVLRDTLGLTGTKFGCGIAQCGACTVFLDGKPLRSCALPVAALGDGEVTTIEGVSGRSGPGGAARLGCPRRAAMRLLPVRAGDERDRAAQRGAAADRPRHRPRHERQHLPLRHLRPHPRRDQRCRAHAGGLTPWPSRAQGSPRRVDAQGRRRPRHRSASAVRCRQGAVGRRAGFHAGRRRCRIRAQRVRAHRHRRHRDGAQQAYRVRPGTVHRPRHAGRRRAGRRLVARCAPSTRRPIPSSTRTSRSACRARAARRAIANSYEQMRKAGATARAMLVEAAAQAWRVPAGEITVERGVLRHARSGRRGAVRPVRAGRGAAAGAGERTAQGPGARSG